ncbi:hypothetical protein [Schaalia sp. Marseille-Q2122]|uniref:hypothetical protein n=1 Tax=Schaalia sp. Marseille-Q2122 TaxID=2736604 RepID=UPI00158F458E|nr:hypothetical protein [Schaalia sp. Marseille-Q2122]
MTESLPTPPASTPWWPKFSVVLLSVAIIALLVWHFLPQAGGPSAAERALYDEALATHKNADEDLALAAGQAVLALRAAQERSGADPAHAPEGLDELRALLEIEPPHYEARDVESLSPEELRAEVERVTAVTEELGTLTHKLSRQAAKVERAVEDSH